MSFTKLQDGRGTYALDSLRLRIQREATAAPQANVIELFIKNNILYQIDADGIEQQIGIPHVTTIQKKSFEYAGAIVFDTTLKKHQGYNGTTWNNLY